MKKICPNLNCAFPDLIIRDGKFRRKEDSKYIQRFRCKCCGTRFSNATFSETFRQKKRHVNFQLLKPEVLVKSDDHQRYPAFISAYLPRARHLTFPSIRSCIAGQGELKKTAFDPLFIVNHTCAILRANINRLIRKTWCSTKDPDRLKDHLDIFMYFYNQHYLKDR